MVATPYLRVFVSSTYLDLVAHREAVSKLLLELRCIPQGMELFPSTASGQWETIVGTIDECDLYLLIVANRYGTLSNPGGPSWTEREYEYAVSKGKEMCVMIHSDPGAIPARDSDSGLSADHLTHFRRRVQDAHLCGFWNDRTSLVQGVSRSIAALRSSRPRTGLIAVPQPRAAVLDVDIVEVVQQAGLASIGIDFYRGVPWPELFANSTNLDLFLTYGRSWRRGLTKELRDFAARPDSRMRVILPDTVEGNTTALPEIAKRAGQSISDVVLRINEAEAEFGDLGAAIWRSDTAQLYASYRFDDLVVVSLYNHQRGNSEGVPTLLCERGGTLFRWFADDFDAIVASDLLSRRSV
jgi:Domain of unknown function (DUF4062)